MKRKFIFFLVILAILCLTSAASAKNELIADTGFRVETNGFGFENYGQQVCTGGSGFGFGGGNCFKVTNLTAEEMVRMYGNGVCKSINKDGSCELTQVAKSWMQQINSVVTNGHCEGMAVLSALFYGGYENPADFGNANVNKLTLKNNTKLQREIAYWFTTQWFMDGHLIENDPVTQLKYLQNAFNKDPNTVYPLGIYQRNLQGGHAILAYAIVKGDGDTYYIMVYDNNYPNEQRYITVDARKNTWSYTGSTSPWASTGSYSGQGKTNMFQIGPIEPRLGQFECDFCTNQPSTPSYYPSTPSYPSYPDDSSTDGYSIWDILSPFINPDSGSDYTIPTQSPSTPSNPSYPSYPDGGGSSIWDILSPWMNPGGGSDYTIPTQSPSTPSNPSYPSYPDGGGSSIWDILSPWLNPGGGSGYEDYFPQQPETLPTQMPTAKPQQPLVRPTAIPSEKQPQKDSYNRISVSSAVNIYIETDNDERSGYDWEKGETYSEIKGVEINRSMGRASAKLPKNLKYYLWMNYPDTKDAETFDASITSPGRLLNLTNIPQAFEYPNFVYSPPTYYKALKGEAEMFEIMAYPNQLPGIEFVITDDNGEYRFKFDTELSGKKAAPNAQVDFLIFHNYDESKLAIWIAAVDDNDLALFKNHKFHINGEFTLYDDKGENVIATPAKSPIELSANGMLMINYRNWQAGKGFTVEIDKDGDTKFESNRTFGNAL